MVKAAALGQDIGAIEVWSGRSERTVRRWVGAYTGGGLDALADSPRSGRPARADGSYLASLESAVESGPRELGLGFDASTSERLSAFLAETTSVRIAPGWLRARLLGPSLPLRQAKAHALAPAGPGGGGEVQGGDRGGREKKSPLSPTGTSCTTRTGRTWRRTRTWRRCGTG